MLPLDPGHGLNAALPDTEGPTAPITTLGLIRWVLWRQRIRVAVGALAGIAWMGALALIPVALGGAVGGAVDGGSGRDVLFWCGVLAAVVALEAGAGVIRHRSATLLYHRTEWLVERLLLRRVLDRRGGVDADAGAVLAHAQVDARAVGAVADLMCRGSGAVVTFTAVGIGMLLTSPLLGAVVLVGLPTALLALVPLWRPYDRRASDQQARLSAATSTAADVLSGMRVVRGLGGETVVRDWFVADSAEVRRSALSLARVGAAWDALSAVIPGLFLAIVLALGGRLALDGDLGAGKLVAFTGLAVFLAIPLATLAEVGDVWASGVAGARRLTATLNAPYAVEDPADPIAPDTAPAPELVLDAVEHPALSGLSFTVGPGELVGLATADPAVTAAVCDLLARRADPTQGQIRLGGRPLERHPLAAARTAVVVESGHAPWVAEASLATNIALRDPHLPAHRTAEALRAAAGDDLLARPEGLDTAVGERGLMLSGGQRQRLAAARAFAGDAPVLVLEDPTSALDTLTEVVFAERLAALRAGRTTLVLTVSPTLLGRCERVLLVEDGAVVAEGAHADLLLTEPRYAALFSDLQDAP